MLQTIKDVGREEGLEKGIEKGYEEARFTLLSKLIQSGMMTIDQVVQATGETYEYIKYVATSIKNKANMQCS